MNKTGSDKNVHKMKTDVKNTMDMKNNAKKSESKTTEAKCGEGECGS